MSSSPFTKEIQNGIRLSQLLINEGTQLLKKIFDREIQLKFQSLSKALITKKQVVTKYYKGDFPNKIPKLLTVPQYKLLYPTPTTQATDSSPFDLTLLTLLLNIVCSLPPPPSTQSWRHQPTPLDTSTAADVIRLRNFRNRIYGHIKSTGVSDNEFKDHWRELGDILIRLGADRSDLKKWETAALDPDTLREIEERLYTLIEHDIADVQVIGTKLLSVLESSIQNLDQNIAKELDEIKDCIQGEKDYDDFIAATIFQIVDSIGSKLHDQHFMLKMITQKEDNSIEEIQALKEEFSKILQIPYILTEQNEKITNVEKMQGEMLEKIDQACGVKNIQAQYVLNNPDLKKVRQIFESNKDAFKVLIINDPKPDTNFTNLAKAVGLVPFDVILDLDHKSLSPDGIYDDVIKILGKHKPVHTVTYKELDKVTENEKEAIAKSIRTLWIQGNGCSVKECDPSVNAFGRAYIPIANMLSTILRKIPAKRSVVCTTLLLNDTVLSQIGQLENAVNGSCEMAYDIITNPPILISLICEEATVTKEDLKITVVDVERVSASAGENQLAFMFEDLYPRGFERTYSFPGNKGPCYLTCEEMTLMAPILDLYHKEIGHMSFEGLDPDSISEQIAEVRDTYQKGSIITHEALYLDAEGRERIYVKRGSTEIVNMVTTIKKCLEVKSQSTTATTTSRYMQVAVVHHDACGGATTCLRHLLYSLKDEYPCIELKHMDQQVCEVLYNLSLRSKLPLLIVAEGSSFNTSDVNSLHNRLSNMWISGLLIHSKRVQRLNSTQTAQMKMKYGDTANLSAEGKYDDMKFYISSHITDANDLAAFRELYHQGQSKRRARRVFLFGLLAFLKDYRKCDEHIMTCVDDLDTIQKTILRIVCTIWQYTHLGVKGRLLLRYYKTERSNMGMPVAKEQSTTQILGYANDILVNTTDYNEAVRPAVDFVADRTLAYLDQEDLGETLKMFTENILSLLETDGEDKLDSSPLLMAIFIQKHIREKDPETKWSQFITDLEERYGVEYVEGVLQSVIRLCQHTKIAAHYRTLYARYLMEKMDRPDEAISQIKRALGIEDEDSIRNIQESENIFLSAYGRLQELRVRKCFNVMASTKSLKAALLMAETNIQEAVFAFKKAQKSTRKAADNRKDLYTPVPFWMEASARHLLLSLILQHKCHNNIVQFRRYLQLTDNEFIQTCEAEGQQALEKLELLIKLDNVHDDNPPFTFERICDIKFKFLRLGVDRKLGSQLETNTYSLKKAVEMQPDNMAFDIGTLMRLESTPGKLRLKYWSDLDKSDLEFIITQIDKRIALSQALSRNYQDIVAALIYIRQLGCTSASKGAQGYNLKYALQCTTLWVKKYPKDFEAHFMHGVLTLISGLEKYDLKMLLDGEASLGKCKEICEQYKSTGNFRKRRFYICKGSGLEKILPSKGIFAEDEVGRGRLEPFTGRLINDKEIQVQHGTFSRTFKATIPGWVKGRSNEVIAQAKKHPRVDFNCIFSHDKIMAFNIQLHQDPPTEENSCELTD